jgi:hypothetical protein
VTVIELISIASSQGLIGIILARKLNKSKSISSLGADVDRVDSSELPENLFNFSLLSVRWKISNEHNWHIT